MSKPTVNIDFYGDGGNGGTANSANQGAANTGSGNEQQAQEDVTDLGKNKDDNNTNGQQAEGDVEQGDGNQGSSTGELTVGTQIEFDGVTYVVNDNGDIVNDKGEVFKAKAEVDAWLKEVEVDDSDNTSEFTIENLQKEIGETIVDANGTPVEFTNDIQGVKAYVNAVLEAKSAALQEAAINTLYINNPILKEVQDYITVHGDLKGFGEVPDRSKISLNKDDEASLVAVILTAAKEFGNKSINANYIQYLKDTGALYDEANNQLKALVEKDKETKENIARQAKERKEAEAKANEEYWNTVCNTVANRAIGGYKIPESFTKEVNGQKIVLTPNDFLRYIQTPVKDAQGISRTGYQADLAKLTPQQNLDRELLDAWLMFTGGTYKDLVNMAINEEKVKQLKILSQKRNTSKTVKIVKPTAGKGSVENILFE